MSLATNLPDDLSAALNASKHAVPSEVVRMYAVRIGPLVMEIRQSLALGRPVPAWLARSRLPDTSPFHDDGHG